MSTFGGPGGSSSMLPSPSRRRACKPACWLVAVALCAVAGNATGLESLDIRYEGRPSAGYLCGGADRNVSNAAAAAYDAISPACVPRSNYIQWNDSNSNTGGFVLLTLFHVKKTCWSTFRVEARPHAQLDLDRLADKLHYTCQQLSGSWISIQRCGGMARGCGPVHKCQDITGCTDPVAARIRNVKRAAVVLRVNTYLTHWTTRKNAYYVLHRDESTGQTATCRPKVICKPTMALCLLTCRGLSPCARYQFCPYVQPSASAEMNGTRCDDPRRRWVSAATRSAPTQGRAMSTMKVRAVRLNGHTVLVTLQGGVGRNSANLTVSASVCLAMRNVTALSCQNLTFAARKQRDRHIVFTGLSALAGYNVSGQLCLGCDSVPCVPVQSKSSQLQPTEWRVEVIEQVAISPAAGAASVRPFRLRWAEAFDPCAGAQCTIVAYALCERAQAAYQLPVSANQRQLKFNWSTVLGGISDEQASTCQIWLSVVLDKGSSHEQQFVISANLAVVVEPDVMETTVNPPPPNSHGADPDHSANPLITIVLSTVFSVATVVILALILRYRYCRSGTALGEGEDARRLLDRTMAHRQHLRRQSPASGGKHGDGHDYQRLKSVRQSLAKKKAADCVSSTVKVISEPTAPPPVPSAPRPTHILPRPCPNQSPPAGQALPTGTVSDAHDYDRLFAADSFAGIDSSSGSSSNSQ